MLHRTRQLLVRQRTMLSNAIRGHMAKLGIMLARAAMARLSCCRLLATSRMIASRRLPGFVSSFLLAST